MNIDVSIYPSVKISEGKLGEYLYTSTNDRIISYLQWEENPVFQYGLGINSSINNFNIQAEGFFSLPGKCGKMFDSDWKIPGVKTNYGIFQNNSVKNWFTSAQVSYSFNINNNFAIIPLFMFSYRYDSFSTNKGTGSYGDSKYSSTGKDESWDSEYAKKCNLSGIDYLRKSLFYNFGIGGKYTGKRINLMMDLMISPYGSFFTKDYHRDDFATDEFESQAYTTITLHTSYFKVFSLKLAMDYSITNNLALFLCTEGIIYPKISGQTATNAYNGLGFGSFEDNDWTLLKQKSAIDLQEVSVKAGCIYKF